MFTQINVIISIFILVCLGLVTPQVMSSVAMLNKQHEQLDTDLGMVRGEFDTVTDRISTMQRNINSLSEQPKWTSITTDTIDINAAKPATYLITYKLTNTLKDDCKIMYQDGQYVDWNGKQLITVDFKTHYTLEGVSGPVIKTTTGLTGCLGDRIDETCFEVRVQVQGIQSCVNDSDTPSSKQIVNTNGMQAVSIIPGAVIIPQNTGQTNDCDMDTGTYDQDNTDDMETPPNTQDSTDSKDNTDGNCSLDSKDEADSEDEALNVQDQEISTNNFLYPISKQQRQTLVYQTFTPSNIMSVLLQATRFHIYTIHDSVVHKHTVNKSIFKVIKINKFM
jgi:hypothetical protein